MKVIQKMLLWLMGVAIPVVIAACYGMAYRFSKAGRVLDAGTNRGIKGLTVTCLSGEAEVGGSQTDEDGAFVLSIGGPCDTVRIEDTDGAENGRYASRTEPFCEPCDELKFSLTPEK